MTEKKSMVIIIVAAIVISFVIRILYQGTFIGNDILSWENTVFSSIKSISESMVL